MRQDLPASAVQMPGRLTDHHAAGILIGMEFELLAKVA